MSLRLCTILMRTTVLLTTSLASLVVACGAAESTAALPVPTPEPVAWHEAGVGLFFHWAPNVHQGGEGDNLSTPRDKIHPDRFNAAQWVQAVKAAGRRTEALRLGFWEGQRATETSAQRF